MVIYAKGNERTSLRFYDRSLWLTNWLIDWLIDWWLTDSDWLTDWLTDWLGLLLFVAHPCNEDHTRVNTLPTPGISMFIHCWKSDPKFSLLIVPWGILMNLFRLIFQLILIIYGWGISGEWMPKISIDDTSKSTLVQVMSWWQGVPRSVTTWCHLATVS